MEQKYLLDTNVLIDAQMGRLPQKGLYFLANVINDHFIISFITLIEYLGYKDITKTSEEFILLADVIGSDNSIILNCIDLRKKNTIKIPDAIIAATALSRNLVLVTNNEKDFAEIQNLTIINLHSL
ncbi:MAG: type II toxin-antitoxin system VapC family toxin [Bacteroidetes bacterium]|nr:type II toxin-antitoxin system VapC family toxin [Bacteroidota bacterium]